jgi:hypothetical protein
VRRILGTRVFGACQRVRAQARRPGARRAQESGHSKEPARATAQGQLHVRVELAAAAAPGQRALGQPGHHAQLGRRRLQRLGAMQRVDGRSLLKDVNCNVYLQTRRGSFCSDW